MGHNISFPREARMKEGEACHDSESKGSSGPESKESVALGSTSEGWIQSNIIGPAISRWLNPRVEAKNPPKANLIWGALLLSAFLAVPTILIMLDVQRNGPAAARVERELNDEFHRIQAPAPSSVQHWKSLSKPHIAFVQASYDTTLSYPEVCAHYDLELSAQGWKYSNEESFGTRIKRCYSKGVYEADLSYEQGLFGGRTFSLGMSWGLSICD